MFTLLAGFWLASSSAAAQVVDCVAAIVDDQVITLLDIRIHERFGLSASFPEGRESGGLAPALEDLINQKVVLGFARGGIQIEKSEIEAELRRLSQKLGPDEMRKATGEFGLTEDDLRDYVAERLVFRKIISQRFSQSDVVTVREMEAYYQETYAPAEKKQGREPSPLVQVLEEIETRIKENKRDAQITGWIRNLRDQAEIQIHKDCLENPSQQEE